MKKIALLLGLLLATPALAADNAVIVTPGVGVTIRSVDIGAGVQAPGHALVNASGTQIGVSASPLFIQGAASAFASGSFLSGAFASGSYASGAFAAGSQVDLLTMRGTVAAGTAAANSLLTGCIYNSSPITLTTGQGSATQCSVNGYPTVVVSNTNANGQAAMAASSPVVIASNQTAISTTPTAGELHIGEIGSNQIKVQVAQTVTASAYAAGNALGGLMTVANAARVSGSAGAAGTGGILTGLQLNSKTIQTGVQVDVFIFDANPTGSTCTDKTAFVIAAADFDKVVGILTIPSTAANGAGWFGATTTGAVGIPTYYPVTYDLASSTSIYACAVMRAAITPAATTDISFKFNMLRN